MARFTYFLGAAGLSAVLVLSGVASANVYINENFDDGVAWDGAGTGTVSTGGDVNHFSDNDDDDGGDAIDDGSVEVGVDIIVTGTPSVTAGGSPISPGNHYAMVAGDSFASTSGFTGDMGGPFTYFQFSVCADSGVLPASTLLARFEMTWDGGAPLGRDFFVEILSDGSGGATIEAGEVAAATSAQIGALPSSSDWLLITMAFNKDPDPETDPRFGNTIPAETVQFWASSPAGTPDLTIGSIGGPVSTSEGFTFTVSDGIVLIDDVYWEQALYTILGYDATASGPLQDPSLLPVELSAFGLE